MMEENGRFDIEAMWGLFMLGVATQKTVSLDPDEQEAVIKEIEMFQKKQDKCDEIVDWALGFINDVKAGDNRKAYSKMFMLDVAITEYNLLGTDRLPDMQPKG